MNPVFRVQGPRSVCNTSFGQEPSPKVVRVVVMVRAPLMIPPRPGEQREQHAALG